MQSFSPSKFFIMLCDALAVGLAIAFIFIFRSSEFAIHLSSKAGASFQLDTLLLFCFTGIGVLALFRVNNLYKYKVLTLWTEQIAQVLKSFFTVGILLIIALFFFKETLSAESSRGYLLGFAVFGVLFVSAERGLITYLVRKKILLRNEIETKKAIVIGAGRSGEMFALRVLNDPDFGIETVWFVDDDPEKTGKKLFGFPIFYGADNIVNHAINTGADEIYVAMNSVQYERLLEIIEHCKKTQLPVKVLSKHFNIVYAGSKSGEINVESAVKLPSQLEIRPGELAKRIIDLAGGLIIALLVFIPCLVVALLVKLTSRGPVFYPSNRVGKGGKIFRMMKFRSMRMNDETEHREAAKARLREGKHMGKVENDPRITPIGAFIRKYSIDELPQIINVLRGDMSLVGPRPCLPYEMELFDDWHKRRFLVLPGLTGLWQVTGRQMKDLGLHDAMMLDVYYAENFTIWLDIQILLKTIPVVLFGKGGK